MPARNLLTMLDDIASVLDDVAVLTKLAARKTAGVLGDDLALNAQQVTGVVADRELPVVWAVAKGSLLNKAVLVPVALAISVWLPWAITPLMMIGGAFLCFEGVEKLAHRFLHASRPDGDDPSRIEHLQALADADIDVVALEKDRIRGAIRTDFILSAEIIVLSLGVVSGQPLLQQVLVLVAIALGMTVGVYGLVAGIVKLDDLGLSLVQKQGIAATAGRAILKLAPWLMKTLSVVGTAAMFLVGGGILVHSIPALHHFIADISPAGIAGTVVGMLGNALVGIAAGAVVLAGVRLVQKFRGRPASVAH